MANPGPEDLPTRRTCGQVLLLNWWQIKYLATQTVTILFVCMTLSIRCTDTSLSIHLSAQLRMNDWLNESLTHSYSD